MKIGMEINEKTSEMQRHQSPTFYGIVFTHSNSPSKCLKELITLCPQNTQKVADIWGCG